MDYTQITPFAVGMIQPVGSLAIAIDGVWLSFPGGAGGLISLRYRRFHFHKARIPTALKDGTIVLVDGDRE